MLKKKLMASLALTGVLFSILAPVKILAATHYVTGSDAVSSGKIKWELNTQHFDMYVPKSIKRWDDLGEVDFREAKSRQIPDLEIVEINDSSKHFYGRYTEKFGTDKIELNFAFLYGKSDAFIEWVVVHELGHALGLGHSYSGNVMDNNSNNYQTNLGLQDVIDYNYLWK